MSYDKELLIADMIARKMTGDATPADEKALEGWLAASGENRALYEKIVSGRSAAEYVGGTAGINDVAAVHGIEELIRRRRVRKRRRAAIWSGGAAAAAFVAAMLAWPGGNAESSVTAEETVTFARADVTRQIVDGSAAGEKARYVRIEVPRGREHKLTLADGSEVWLNAETTIEYPEPFDGASREIKLRGEAYFEVAADPSRPFTINTASGLTVRVLGTKFNVQSYADVPDTRVTVAEGSVSVSNRSEEVVLRPNQQAVFSSDRGAMEVRELEDTANTYAWINGMFDFRDRPLAQILDAVSKWYNVEIIVTDEIDMGSQGHFTLKASRRCDIGHLLRMLHTVTGLSYRVDGGRVYITRLQE